MSKTTEYYCAECGRSGERYALVDGCARPAKHCPMRNKEEQVDEAETPDPSWVAPVPGYERLQDVLDRAYDQAARGKGKERHAKDLPFHEQPMQTVTDLSGLGFPIGQAAKKAQESMRMEPDAAVRELLGAINYLAGAIIWIEGQGKCTKTTAQ